MVYVFKTLIKEIGKMSESKANQCEFHLIKAWMPVSKPYLKASVKSITDLKISGFSDTEILFSTAILPENRYLAIVQNEISDIQIISQIDLKSKVLVQKITPDASLSMLVKDTVILTTGFNETLHIYKDGQSIGTIALAHRQRTCKSGFTIMNRWLQQRNGSVYIIDSEDNLYQIAWPDIMNGGQIMKTLIAPQIEDFFAATNRLAMIGKDGNLKLSKGKVVNLESIWSKSRASIVIRLAKHWIVSGDLDGQAIILSFSGTGKLCSRVTIDMTSSKSRDMAMMYCLQTVVVERGRAVALAVEREGCSHLLSMTCRGLLYVVFTLPCLLDDSNKSDRYKMIFSLSTCSQKGEILVCGYGWLKMIKIKIN